MILCKWVHSSAVEHGIADPAVTGSIPVAPFLCCFQPWFILLVFLIRFYLIVVITQFR